MSKPNKIKCQGTSTDINFCKIVDSGGLALPTHHSTASEHHLSTRITAQRPRSQFCAELADYDPIRSMFHSKFAHNENQRAVSFTL